MDISCAFATSRRTPEHIQTAEDLGYTRAWCYDSPALYPDVWMTLALAADRTSSIGLGPAVLVPSLRHPMVNASAIATLAGLAPGRIAVAIGAGFTGRYTLGQRAMRWSEVAQYVQVLRGLLRGEPAQWEGALIRMIQPAGFVAERPLDVPVLIAADGPKGQAVAIELGDGMFSAGVPATGDGLPPWRALLTFGTVLADGEDVSAERVVDAAGHALAVVYHGSYERGGATAVDALPGGRRWRQAIEAVPPESRHLAIHANHLVAVSESDRAAVDEGMGLLPVVSMTGTAADLRARVEELSRIGVTEIAYQPAGRDIPGELERFLHAVS
jgi:5,10-methylenetetrahydromethanopterin reductase